MDVGIRILGPVELRQGEHVHAPGSPKERLLLAALALDVGRPISLDTLVDRLWEDACPTKPRASLHVYATRVRQRLAAAGRSGQLVQEAHCYRLDADPGQVDWHRYQHLTAQARSLADRGEDDAALTTLQEAEELWRGEPLAGLGGLWPEHVRAMLGDKRLAVQLSRFTVALRQGRFAEVLPDAAALWEEHPGDEALAEQLMVAAYGSGRQADALRVYDTVRRHLQEQLGTDPGEALTRMQRFVLRGRPVRELFPPREHLAPDASPESRLPTATHPVEPDVAAPRTLPSHAELVGRQEELASILRAAAASARATAGADVTSAAPSGAVIALHAISGMAGVGKSLLALHAARRLGSLYPDGQIHLDLRGHAPGQAPLTPQAALTALLRVLGVATSAVPDGLDALVALWRTLLSTRRAVIVLDDAFDAEQLRPLLPGPSPSLVLITSRRRLTGLPGLLPLRLDVLPPEDGASLFRRLAGEHCTTKAHEVAEIVRICGHLPLGIELAARRLASRPSWTTGHLLRRLTHGHGRLREIRDGRHELVRVFEVSYQTLTREEQTVFRSLGMQLAPDFDLFTTATLANLDLERVERALESLQDAHLIQEPTPERYTLHDLLGDYARTLVAVELSLTEQESATRRLINFYLHATNAADRLIYPRRMRPPSFGLPAAPGRTPAWESVSAARRWLAAERSGLVAAERYCRTHGRLHDAALLAGALAGFLDEEGYAAEAERMHESAARHWRTANEPKAEISALVNLGSALSHRGQYERALAVTAQALHVARNIENVALEAEVLHLRGVLHWNMGRLQEALAIQSETRALRVASGDLWQIARSENNLGITRLYLGHYEEADRNLRSALAGFRASDDPQEEAHVLNNLSELRLRTGDRASSREFLAAALNILNVSGTPSERAMAQVNMANSMNSPEDLPAMLDMYRDSLAAFRRCGDRRNASITLHEMGRAFHAAGRFREAAEHQLRALDLARSIGAGHEEAQAQHALGLAEHRLGDTASAARRLKAAIRTAERNGAMEEAARARESLAAMGHESGAAAQPEQRV